MHGTPEELRLSALTKFAHEVIDEKSSFLQSVGATTLTHVTKTGRILRSNHSRHDWIVLSFLNSQGGTN